MKIKGMKLNYEMTTEASDVQDTCRTEFHFGLAEVEVTTEDYVALSDGQNEMIKAVTPVIEDVLGRVRRSNTRSNEIHKLEEELEDIKAKNDIAREQAK